MNYFTVEQKLSSVVLILKFRKPFCTEITCMLVATSWLVLKNFWSTIWDLNKGCILNSPNSMHMCDVRSSTVTSNVDQSAYPVHWYQLLHKPYDDMDVVITCTRLYNIKSFHRINTILLWIHAFLPLKLPLQCAEVLTPSVRITLYSVLN